MKRIYLLACLSIITSSIFAQKLPDIQEAVVTVPSNIKIDGKSTEWNDVFAAENKRTDLFYSMTNDEKNLYLIIKSSTSANINKIMLGGISFVINTQGKKKEKDAPTITFPVINRANRQQGGRGGQGGQARQGGQGGFQNRTQQTAAQRDSAAMVQRKTQLAGVKEIKVSGFKSITDSLISIYNEYGIKAVAAIDAKGAYVYELAIPLAILDLSGSKEIAYQIKLNGLVNMGFGNGGGAGNFGGGNRGGGAGGGNFGGGGNAGGGQDLMSPTDFWGKYAIQKNK